MKIITFIRHAESISNAGGITMPHADIPLSARGQLQAQDLAGGFGFVPSLIITSGMLRTQQTAAPLCERFGLQHQVDDRLNEFHVISEELIAGMTGRERRPLARAFWGDPDRYRRLGENADTFAEFDSRVSTFIAGIDTLPDRAVVIGHGIWYGLMLYRLLAYQVDDAAGIRAFREFQQSLPMPNCASFHLLGSDRENWILESQDEHMQLTVGLHLDHTKITSGAQSALHEPEKPRLVGIRGNNGVTGGVQ